MKKSNEKMLVSVIAGANSFVGSQRNIAECECQEL